jgi:outer membrane protein W
LFAQSGSWYVGGSASLRNSKPENGTGTTSWGFSPEVGTFLSNQIQVGGALRFTGGSNDFISKSFGITPYGRYFFQEGKSFRPFLGAGLPFSRSNGQVVSGTTVFDLESQSFGLSLNGGFAYGISDKWAVLGSLGFLQFLRTSSKLNIGPKSNSFDTNLGVNTLGNPFNIGIYYTFKS